MDGAQKNNRVILGIRNALCGALIGVSAILPGVSAGVLAVIFGIYRPMMEALTSPKTALPKYWKDAIPLGIGWLIGFVGIAQGLTAAYQVSETVTVWLFIGLIAGTGPSLLREARKEKISRYAGLSFALCTLSLFAALFYLRHMNGFQAEPNLGWFTFCGALWGLSVVIPGLTSSSIMMALGLYEPMMQELAELDVVMLAACLPGMLLTILLSARIVTWLFHRFYSVVFHGIIGIVFASTLVIIPEHYGGLGEIVLSILSCGLGFFLAFFLARLDRKIQSSI